MDTMDCGPTCLRIIAKYYGKSFSLQTLRDYCHISREGVSLLGDNVGEMVPPYRLFGTSLDMPRRGLLAPLAAPLPSVFFI